MVITHPLTTSGILYADVAFDYSDIDLEDLELLPLFSRMLMESGTSTLDQTTLQRFGLPTYLPPHTSSFVIPSPFHSLPLHFFSSSPITTSFLRRRIGANTGGISVSYHNDLKRSAGRVSDSNDVLLYMLIRGKAVTDNVPVMLDLFTGSSHAFLCAPAHWLI